MSKRNKGSLIQKLILEGKSYSEIQSIVDCNKSTISYHASKLSNPNIGNRTPSKEDEIVQLLEQGIAPTEIRKKTGVAWTTINKYRRQLGLPIYPAQKKYDWNEVQAKFHELQSVRKTIDYFGMRSRSWDKAVRRGDVVSHNYVKNDIETYLVKDRPQTSRSALKARLLDEGLLRNHCYDESCRMHGVDDPTWNGKPLRLHLDHINGVKDDNRLENLQLLCPNCHSQTPTYGGRNVRKSKCHQ